MAGWTPKAKARSRREIESIPTTGHVGGFPDAPAPVTVPHRVSSQVSRSCCVGLSGLGGGAFGWERPREQRGRLDTACGGWRGCSPQPSRGASQHSLLGLVLQPTSSIDRFIQASMQATSADWMESNDWMGKGCLLRPGAACCLGLTDWLSSCSQCLTPSTTPPGPSN